MLSLVGGVVSCRIFTAITKSHPQYSDVIKSDLDKCLPSLQDVQSAFLKVRQICVVGEPVGVKCRIKFNPTEAALFVIAFSYPVLVSCDCFGSEQSLLRSRRRDGFRLLRTPAGWSASGM